MIKLVADSTVCWIGDEGEWNVGTTFKDVFKQLTCFHKGGLVPCLLVRHKHTCELEYVPTHLLSDYPMEPIPEPGVADATMGLVKQEVLDQQPWYMSRVEDANDWDLPKDLTVQEWRTPTDDDVIAFVRKYGKRPTCRMRNHDYETWWSVTGELLLVDTRSSATCPFYVRTKEPDRQNWFRYCQIAIPESERLGPSLLEAGWPRAASVDDVAKAKEIVANGNAWFDDLERNYLK